MWHQQWPAQHSQVLMEATQDAGGSVCYPGYKKGVFPQEVYEVGDIIQKLVGGAITRCTIGLSGI